MWNIRSQQQNSSRIKSNLIDVIYNSPFKTALPPHLHWPDCLPRLGYHFMSWIISHQISISQWERCLKKRKLKTMEYDIEILTKRERDVRGGLRQQSRGERIQTREREKKHRRPEGVEEVIEKRQTWCMQGKLCLDKDKAQSEGELVSVGKTNGRQTCRNHWPSLLAL